MGLPPLASAQGGEIDLIIFLMHVLMLVLLVGWGVFFIYVLFRFRAKRNPKANYTGVTNHYSTYIEGAVALIEALLLIGFSIPFWAKNVSALPTDRNPIEIRLVAEQFAWDFHYPGADGIFGKTDIKFIDKQSNPLGLDKADPASKDDIVSINQLYLPVNRQAVIHVSSKDVIHSFALNVMRVKQDAIPGMSIPVWFTPTQTGHSEIACAQLCGLGHYRMKGDLYVVTNTEYDTWLASQAKTSTGSGEEDFWN